LSSLLTINFILKIKLEFLRVLQFSVKLYLHAGLYCQLFLITTKKIINTGKRFARKLRHFWLLWISETMQNYSAS